MRIVLWPFNSKTVVALKSGLAGFKLDGSANCLNSYNLKRSRNVRDIDFDQPSELKDLSKEREERVSPLLSLFWTHDIVLPVSRKPRTTRRLHFLCTTVHPTVSRVATNGKILQVGLLEQWETCYLRVFTLV